MRNPPTRDRYISATLDAIGPVNRPLVGDFVARLQNRGLATSSVYNYAHVLRGVDAHVEGRPLVSIRPQDCQTWLTALQGLAQATRWQHAILLRAFLKWALQVRELPHDLADATYVRPPAEASNGRVLTDSDFDAMLQASSRTDGRLAKWARTERTQAILWALWDTGFRAQELLSLKIGSVTWDGPTGARINLPPQRATPFRLKTGPRTIYVVECVGPLRVWLAMHPAGTDANAPLFPHSYDHTGQQATQYQSLAQQLYRLGRAAGLNENQDIKRVSAHDFRHTRATRAARAGWMEAELRAYFGWRPGSRMPSIYVHLAMDDMRDRVRRDAGVDGQGYQAAAEAGDELATLKGLLRNLISEPQQATRTKPPAEWERR